MAALQGHTLGERQKYYNKLVLEAQVETPADIPAINYDDDDDVKNMIKVDIACNRRNVDYILEVFKCDDMFYVSRAIKKSTWLITDPQYAHVINPQYLHKEVFPQMNIKAVTKLMLHIRIHLKDETRLIRFYNYVNKQNPKAALCWLQNCSLEFIKQIVRERITDIPKKLLKRLFRRSITILQVYMKHLHYTKRHKIMKLSLFLLKGNMKEYLDLYDNYHYYEHVHFGARNTHFLMKKCPKRVISHYFGRIDVVTVVKFIKRDEIECFLEEHFYGLRNFYKFDVFSPFLRKMPRERVLPLLSKVLDIDQDCDEDDISYVQKLFTTLEASQLSRDLYRWYQFVPFNIAFPEIVKLIFNESSPEERTSLLILLLTCASYDFEHVKTVLQYYYDKQVNEIYKHKIKFINSLLTQHNTFRFDDSTWNTVNSLFHTLGVYIESGDKVQMCIIAIILYKVIRDQPVPETVEEKFEFETLRNFKKNLNHEEQDKLFKYLYNFLVTKLLNQNTDSETGMHEAIELLKYMWNLIKDWEKEETHHEMLIDKIAELGNIYKACSWYKAIPQRRRRRKQKPRLARWQRRRCKKNSGESITRPPPYINFPGLYKMVQPYRKKLFENSLILNACEEVCLNALKHDPGLLVHHQNAMHALRCDDHVSLKRFLRKLRIYWPHSLATEWAENNINDIENGTGHRALVRGIIILLPLNKLKDYIKKFTPEENKVVWGEVNEIDLSHRKHIAKHMHLARPQLSADIVLWFAKGDYLQYALLSLNTLYYNLRSSDIEKYIHILLKAPVSLRKHGIRLAFAKFKPEDLINQLSVMWKSSRNSSIRANIFVRTLNLLCKETKPMRIKEIWAILSSFIDSLNHEEDKTIYTSMKKVKKVPHSVIGECYQKTFLFLKSLPPKVDLENTLDRVTSYAAGLIGFLDCEFVENSLLGSVYDFISDSYSVYTEIITCYLLHSKTVNIQMQKYNNLLRPVIEQCVPKWVNNEELHIKDGCQELLHRICRKIPHFVFVIDMVVPVELMGTIQNALIRGSFGEHDDYKTLARWRLAVAYVKLLETKNIIGKEFKDTHFNHILVASSQELAQICVQQFTEDVIKFYPSIYLIFAHVFNTVFNDFSIECCVTTPVLDKMLNRCKNPLVYLLVLKILPSYEHSFQCECSKKLERIHRKISNHQSKEVSMHYFQQQNEVKFQYNGNTNRGWGSSDYDWFAT